MPQDDAPTYIGRGGAAVPDPLDRLRPLLGRRAREIDDRATAEARALADEDDAALQAQREQLGPPERELDAERAARAAGLDQEVEAARRAYGLAAERHLASSRTRRLLTEVERGELAVQAAGTERRYEAQLERHADSPDVGYRDRWVEDYGDVAARAVAVERERAIRDAQRASGEERAAAPPEGARYREIGTAAESERAQQRLASDAERRSEPGSVHLVGPEEVPAPPRLQELQGALGPERMERLTEQMAPLEAWVAEQDTEWVKTRHEELGPPPHTLHRPFARRTQRLEARTDELQQEIDAVQPRAEIDPGAARSLERATEELARNDGEIETMRTRGLHPDQWVDANEQELIVRGVYEREAAIRERMEQVQQLARAPGREAEPAAPEAARAREADGPGIG